MTEDETMTEREAMKLAKGAIYKFKKMVRLIRVINTKKGNFRAANAAYLIEGKAAVLHAEATEELHKFWPEHADGVQAEGGDR